RVRRLLPTRHPARHGAALAHGRHPQPAGPARRQPAARRRGGGPPPPRHDAGDGAHGPPLAARRQHRAAQARERLRRRLRQLVAPDGRLPRARQRPGVGRRRQAAVRQRLPALGARGRHRAAARPRPAAGRVAAARARGDRRVDHPPRRPRGPRPRAPRTPHLTPPPPRPRVHRPPRRFPTVSSTDSAQLLADARRLIPGGVNSATRAIGRPEGFRAAQGATLVDLEGRSYVDYHCAFGATLLGHGDPRVDRAVADTFGVIDVVGLGVTELEIECARLVADLIPSVEMSITTMSGSESTFQAVRLARAVTGRPYLVKFQGCFHGWHDAVARNVISPPERAYDRDPLSAGILDEAVDATLIAEFNDLDSVAELFRRHPDQIAAVILEPVPHNVGALLPEQAFLEGLRELTTREGSLLIFDEVITGFRHAPGGYQELCGVVPDLTTYGKAMGNGHSVAGMGGRADLMSRFSSAGGDVLLAGTFNGNPQSMAAAVATMTAISDPEVGFHDHVYRLGDRMRAGLREIV